jgi:hypothetical protein
VRQTLWFHPSQCTIYNVYWDAYYINILVSLVAQLMNEVFLEIIS